MYQKPQVFRDGFVTVQDADAGSSTGHMLLEKSPQDAYQVGATSSCMTCQPRAGAEPVVRSFWERVKAVSYPDFVT